LTEPPGGCELLDRGSDLDAQARGEQTVGMKDISRSGWILGIMGVTLAVVVVVAIVLALQPPEQFDPGTPEATVQDYLQAVIDGDQGEVALLMTPELLERCGTDLIQVRHSPDSFRAVIVDTNSIGDRTAVNVEITEGSDGGLFSDSWSFEETLVVEHDGAGWLIAESPWPIYCAESTQP